MINGNNMYIQTAGMNIRKDNDDWRRAVDTVDAAEVAILTEKTITENGTYTAAEDNADGYSSVTVDVPNTYTVQDEGKVVSDGALVAQTAYPTEITENDTYDTTNYNSIIVNVSGGGGGAGGGDVIFYDYDGTIVTSYSAADFANLSDMPANPTHTGLTAQGWNWSLADAKAYVASYGKLNIGQMYITSDGKTRLYYVISKDSCYNELSLTLDPDTELDVDWGDGTEHTTWTSNDGDSSKSHDYSNGGRYTVAITVVSGGFTCKSLEYNDTTLKKVEFGSGVTSLSDYIFNDCYTLSSVTIPNSVTSIGHRVFYNCSALTSITIPNSVTSIDGENFYYCHGLTSIILPNSVTSFESWNIYECCALSSITIPNSVTSIGNAICQNCYGLTSITIPSSVTSIGEGAFLNCYALTSITIPSSVTSIGEGAFSSCDVLSSITFEPTTPPTLNSTLYLPITCIIRVPQGTLEDYTSTQRYPDLSEYIYEEY